jgi:hypothetical protein
MRFLRVTPLLLVPAVVVPTTGCSRSDRQPVYPAQGQVLYDGKPIPHALVVLHPLSSPGKEALRPHANVGAGGQFVLGTYEPGDGAPAGEYAVTIEWWLSPAKPGTREGDGLPPVNRLPARYSQAATSGLRVRIQPGDNQLPVLKLSR